MPVATARLLLLPAGLLLLAVAQPASRSPRPVPVPEPPRAVAPPVQEIPRIVAVNQRVARRVNALRPCVKQRLVRVAQKLPKRVTLLVTSAHRTRAEQASLRGTFGVKARPGTSTHEDGRAIDLNVLVDGTRISPRKNQQVIGAVMAAEGFRHLGPRDPVHYSIPKPEIDASLTQGPHLEVMTWDEMRQIQVEVARDEAPPAAAGGVETARGRGFTEKVSASLAGGSFAP